jgi:hypothetical protein
VIGTDLFEHLSDEVPHPGIASCGDRQVRRQDEIRAACLREILQLAAVDVASDAALHGLHRL